jgi:hypothetical protein
VYVDISPLATVLYYGLYYVTPPPRVFVALEDAVRRRNIEQIQEAIDVIKRKGFQHRLQRDIADAEYQMMMIRKTNKMTGKVLKMDRTTLMELRSYVEPPNRTVHLVMQALYLLLEEDESKTVVRIKHMHYSICTVDMVTCQNGRSQNIRVTKRPCVSQ